MSATELTEQMKLGTDDLQPKKKRGRPPKLQHIEEVQERGVFVALDFGNHSTKVSTPDNHGEPRAIPDPDGLYCTPSYIGYEDGNPEKILVGRSCCSYEKFRPEFICTYSKRTRGHGAVPAFLDCSGEPVLTSVLDSQFIKWRLAHVEQYLGRRIAGVLVTVPAHFDDAGRRATLAAIQQAGFTPLGVLNEPTAAVLGYAKGKQGTFGVWDLGGGTFDISILRSDGKNDYTVLASNGQDQTAGKECTSRLYQACLDHVLHMGAKFDPAASPRDATLLQHHAETAKIDLSTQERTVIVFSLDGQSYELEFSRAEFEGLIPDLLETIENLTLNTLRDAHLNVDDVTGIILAGGACRMVCIQRLAEKIFGPDKVLRNIDPDLAVVLGACQGIGIKIEERIAAGDVSLEGQVPAYQLRGDMRLREVLGKPLGVRAWDTRKRKDVLAVVLPENTPLPAKETRVFGLMNGNHSGVEATIVVLQGYEDDPLDQAQVLAEFPLSNLPAGPTENRIEVTYSVDSGGLVEVYARDLFSGVEIRGQVDARSAVAAQSVA